MADQNNPADAALVAGLNDLLQLDHDAIQAYSIAIARIRNETYKQTLREFKADHERHIEELTRLVKHHGGTPVPLPHLPSGVFKLAVQAVGALGGDRGVLLAFKSNERQVRDKYRRMAEQQHTDTEMSAVLSRAAGDESRHYSWVLETLEDLGVGANTRAGKIENAFETGHARLADAMESGEREVMRATETARRGLSEEAKRNPWRTVLVAVGAGLVAAQLLNRDR
jgi:rubrerythrin